MDMLLLLMSDPNINKFVTYSVCFETNLMETGSGSLTRVSHDGGFPLTDDILYDMFNPARSNKACVLNEQNEKHEC